MGIHVAGDLLKTNAQGLAAALDGLHRFRKKSEEELRLEGDNLSFEIYAIEGIGDHYLVSGLIEGTLDEARQVVQEIAARLYAHGIVFGFELNDEDDWDRADIVQHPDFQSTE